jgi:hypothetical protein
MVNPGSNIGGLYPSVQLSIVWLKFEELHIEVKHNGVKNENLFLS